MKYLYKKICLGLVLIVFAFWGLTNTSYSAEFEDGDSGVNIGEAVTLGEGGESIAGAQGYTTIGEFIMSVLPNVLVVANIILFFFILFGGFKMISGAGNSDQQADARKIITYAIIGFVIIFGAYWLIQLLGNVLGSDVL